MIPPVFQRWRERLRALSRKPETIRRGALADLSPAEAQTLREIAMSEAPNFMFPARLERHFQSHIRAASRPPRIVLSAATFLVFLAMPLWLPLVLALPPEIARLMTLMQVGFLAPMFALVTLLLLRWPDSIWTEGLFLAAFIIEIACAETFRYVGEASGAATEPLMSICVPVAVLTLARLPIVSCILFVLAYFAIIAAGSQLWPEQLGRRLPTTWLLEVLVVSMTLLSAIWSRLSFRRQWAANVLTEVMAYRDPLTGLANRRAFDDHYHMVLEQAQQERKPLAVALLDLDHFKRLNDLYGHEYGDGALVEIALALAEFAQRPLDLAARLGGEEFALLLYDHDPDAARARLAELLQQVRDLRIPHSGSDKGVLTCSIGAAMVQLDLPLSESYRVADEMLYRVKRAGRDDCALAT